MQDVRSASVKADRERHRRLRPRAWDTDWLVLKGMRRAIDRFAAMTATPGASVLDFGCGDEPYASLFTSRGARYTGADFGSTADLTVDEQGRLDATDQSFDVVVSFQVLEHVRDLDTYFAEVRRVLRPEGRLLLSTHGSWFYHPHPEDHRRWTRHGLTAELGAHGFEVSECRPVVGPLAYATILRITMIAYVLRAVPIAGPAVARCLTLVANARARLEDAITPADVTQDNACVYVTLSRRVSAWTS
jgi:2-polyprenyl-3-methyl-5-hydroxy-6-metoxy-1,4-benzoquinol methylase